MSPGTVTGTVTTAQREAWERDGFFRIAGFADPGTCDAMLERVVGIARAAADGSDVAPALVLNEAQGLGPRPNPEGPNAEEIVSKVFRLHRDSVFHDFATDARV